MLGLWLKDAVRLRPLFGDAIWRKEECLAAGDWWCGRAAGPWLGRRKWSAFSCTLVPPLVDYAKSC